MGRPKTTIPVYQLEKNLVNQKHSLERYRLDMERAINRYNRSKTEVAFFEFQIKTAKENGTTEFDPELYLKK